MNVQEVSDQLLIHPLLSKKQVVDLLFNIGETTPWFTELLAITHSKQMRKAIMKMKDLGMISFPKVIHGTLVNRVITSLTTNKLHVTPVEYHILLTLVEPAIVTTSMREKLQDYLEYTIYHPKSTKSLLDLQECGVCSSPTKKIICTRCFNSIQEFTAYRRDSFRIPINYVNFAINAINIESEFIILWEDWSIQKIKGTSTVYVMLDVGSSFGMNKEFPLPFVEYQKVIV